MDKLEGGHMAMHEHANLCRLSSGKYGPPVRETAPVPKTTTQKLIAGVGTRLG